MGRSSSEISRMIRARLKVLDPDISAEPGTPERKIIDTVADTIAEAEIDQFVLDYQYDIDTKLGDDLDRFVSLFGFARQGGRQSTGTISFSRTAAADTEIYIPLGTQVVKPATSVSPAVVYLTTASVTVFAGGTGVDSPIQAVDPGEAGNAPAHSIISLGSGDAFGISSITNNVATSGGSDPETDAELRIRFKNTVFRNIAGTRDQFLALATASRFTKKAIVIGPMSRFTEYIQIEADLTSASQLGAQGFAKYIYAYDYFLSNGDPGDEIFFSSTGDYTLAIAAGPPATSNLTAVLANTTLSGSFAVGVDTSMFLTSGTGFGTSGTVKVGVYPPVYASYTARGTPPTAPTVAVGIAGLLNGSYTYKVTFVYNGETLGGTTSAVVSPATQKVDLTAIPLGPTGTTARKIYRTLAGGADGTQKLLATISDNTTTVYTDNIVDGSLGAVLPVANTFGILTGVVSSGSGSQSIGTQVTQGILDVGQNYLLEQTYCSMASRNDPANNIMMYVDIFVSGSDDQSVVETLQFPPTGNAVVSGGSTRFSNAKYNRDGTTTLPTVGNWLQFPSNQPIVSLPSTITIGASIFVLGTHYWLVKDITTNLGSRRGSDAIEWSSAVTTVAGTQFVPTYVWNRVPLAVNEIVDTYKSVTQDVLVHAAKLRYFNVNLVIMYSSGVSPSAVEADIISDLSDWMEKANFGALIQFSDITNVVADVNGVDAVRIARNATPVDDATTYGVQEVSKLTGAIIASYTGDFGLLDSQLPILNSVKFLRRAQNTWAF